MEDFYFHPTKDSLGGDLGQVNGDLQEVAVACRKHPLCVGFNSNGFLKEALSDYSDWYKWTEDQTKGFYTKTSCYDVDSIDQWPCSVRQSTFNMCSTDSR